MAGSVGGCGRECGWTYTVAGRWVDMAGSVGGCGRECGWMHVAGRWVDVGWTWVDLGECGREVGG